MEAPCLKPQVPELEKLEGPWGVAFFEFSRGRLIIHRKYDSLFVAAMKSLPQAVRYYDKETRAWIVDAAYLWGEYLSKTSQILEEFISPLGGLWLRELADRYGQMLEQRLSQKVPTLPVEGLDELLKQLEKEGKRLFEFQKAGVERILELKRVLVADEQGLGKSVTAAAALALIPFKRALIVCPAGLRLNWKKELEAFCPPARAKGIAVLSSGKDTFRNEAVIIVSYDLAEKVLKVDFDVLVLDEVHYIKNPQARRTEVCLELANKAEYVIALSGTPFLNKPVELYCPLRALGFSMKFFTFAKTFCDAKLGEYGWDFSGSSNLEILRRLLARDYLIRREKALVWDQMPEKIRGVIPIPASLDSNSLELEQEVRKILQQIKGVTEKFKELKSEGRAEEAQALLKEQGHLFLGGVTILDRYREEAGMKKVPVCVQFVKNLVEAGESVVIFFHHRKVLERLKEELETEGIAAVHVTGETPLHERQKAVEVFQAGTVPVFLGSIRASGEGITLTRASHVVFVQLDWSPAKIMQAEDRCHRIGQRRPVNVYFLALRSEEEQPLQGDGSDLFGSQTVDEYLIRRLVEKMEAFREVFGGGSLFDFFLGEVEP